MRTLLPSRPTPRLHTARALRGLLLPLLLALVAAAASACLHRGKAGKEGAADDDARMPLPEYVFVNVENHNFADVVISIVPSPGARAMRIGSAIGNAKTTLRFPGRYIAASAPLQLQANAIGGRSVLLSDRFTVQPGQQVSWTIETSLARSSLAVY